MRKLAYHLVTAAISTALLASFLAGCGGSGSTTLKEGVYESNVTEQYLLQNGFSAENAARDGGKQVWTLSNGSFTYVVHMGASQGDLCTGTYKDESGRATFTWISGCFGDWSASYTINGDQVTWSDSKALPPYDSADEQHQQEVFSAVPWTRTGDSPSS